MNEQKPMNIYQILNQFNKKFGMEPEAIKLKFVSEHHIYLEMVYGDYDESKPLWHYDITHTNKNYGMVQIWVTRNKETKKPEFILWKQNGIYVNSFTMPDREMAAKFQASVCEMAVNEADFLINKYNVELSSRLLNQIINNIHERIEEKIELMYDATRHKKIKTYPNIYLGETKRRADDISMSIETLQILQEELENRKKGERS